MQRLQGQGLQGLQDIQGTQGLQGLNGRRFAGMNFDGMQPGGQRGQLGNGLRFGDGTFGGNALGVDRFGTGGTVGTTRFADAEFGGRFGNGVSNTNTGRNRFVGETFQGGRGTTNTLGGTRFGGNDLRLAGNGRNGLNGLEGMRAATARTRLGTGRQGQTLGGTRLGTAGTGINGLGATGLGGRLTGANAGLQGGIMDGGIRDNTLLARRRLRANRLGANVGGGAQRTSLLGGLGQDVNNMFVDPITFQRVRVLNTNDASNIIARRTNNEPASRRRATNRLNMGRTVGRTNDASRNLRAGAPVRRIPNTNTLRRRLGTGTAISPVGTARGRAAAPARQRSSSLTNNVDWAMLDELMQQQSRQQRVTDSVTTNRASQPAATATDGFSLNQLDLSQFTANLDSLGATGLDPQQTAFLPVSTLQSSQTAAASLAAQETARAAAAQQRVAILASRRNQAAINALADSQAARNVAASQAARSAAASQAARSAVAAQAARSAAASQTRPVANMQDTAADQVLRRAVAEQSSDAVTLPAFQATRRRGPIFAIVPLTSRANIDDMRKFVQELSASINMASNEPTVGDNLLQSSLLPLGIQRETAAIGLPNASVAADSLPSVRPIQVINTVSAESNIPGEGPMTIMSDQPFAVPIPIQDPIAIRNL
ncbi:uncharacterized protein LOC110447552 isoform X4 [Mizuhopecten yessoensis]|uniref:uncharacterized protein LOC110447552 isoform X4 n=1 Tax=Mizuhopecten yessoensis TaxID=6573 RepID=UPI000B45BABF|nr:uncharacterized protein LOC110447552 isoform X4 [Mizuhopecten yessoensis]